MDMLAVLQIFDRRGTARANGLPRYSKGAWKYCTLLSTGLTFSVGFTSGENPNNVAA